MPLFRLIAVQSQEVERGKATLGLQRAALEAAQAQAGALGGVVWFANPTCLRKQLPPSGLVLYPA